MSLTVDNEKIAQQIRIVKMQDGNDVTTRAAFKGSESVEFLICIPRSLGVFRACLCVEVDEGNDFDVEFCFEDIINGCDVYKTRIDFSLIFPAGDGLMYFQIKFESGNGTFYTQSINNVDFNVVNFKDTHKHRILVYNKNMVTPLWAKKGIMYQIFVDRFFKGSVKIPLRSDAKINNDWYEGVPEYSHNGEAIENNTHFGGTLYGVVEKLDYLKELGVDILYLNPVFEAYSNHKYDTGDYEKIDSMFGGNDAFLNLVKELKKRDMHLILDGVFNHTGSDSKYFNKKGKYETVGAYQSSQSEYFNWYFFYEFPDNYESWWGIDVLPRINGKKESVREYFLSENGVVRKWLRMGADGWRLDVADELDDEFLTLLKTASRLENKDSLIIGEVWENAADKISYGKRRKYFRGHQLDSVMNYPIKEAIINFVKFGDEKSFYNTVTDIYSSTPEPCSAVMMNLLSSHDTVRIITRLAGENGDGRSKYELSEMRLSDEQFERGKKLLFLATVLQFTLPGIPCIYYGDEIGMQGYSDPFCRLPYAWGNEDKEILSHYKNLCTIRKNENCLHSAKLEFVYCKDGVVMYKRGSITVAVNASDMQRVIEISGDYKDLLFADSVNDKVILEPVSAKILKKKAESC